MTADRKVAVGILGYNSAAYLTYLFDSLDDQDFQKNVFYYYIDNNSTDHSINLARKHKLDIEIITNEKNDGYAGAYEVFMRERFGEGYDAVVLLNPDVIVDKSWIKELVLYAYSDDSFALIQPKILQLKDGYLKSEQLSSCGGFLHYLGFGILNRDVESSKKISFASGSCLLIKSEFYKKCGGLDQDFFMYLEDVDISWRAQICGYACGVAEQSIIWHHYVFDRFDDKKRKKFYYLERNRLVCMCKNYSYRTLFLLFPAIFIIECGVFVHAIIKGYFMQKCCANIDFVKNIAFIREKHCIVQSLRVVSDGEIFNQMIARVRFDELDGIPLKMANIFFVVYYKIVKFFL
ncbi:MAG: hypothetical protein CR972_00745 [Candidatus Moraniibacteriota bacterium]|nr:MAG: hypothetical protein CR972_00745 [Candidatus Moranbacteria bacterium]